MLSVVESQSPAESGQAPNNLVEKFKTLYETLNKDTLNKDTLALIYSADLVFQDPLHRIEGIENLYSYFEGLYENVEVIEFEFHDQIVDDKQAFLTWTMRFKHPYVNRGKWISVDGSSQLRFEKEHIIYHRDYFDAGAMLYEHVPGIAFVIRQLKKRMG